MELSLLLPLALIMSFTGVVAGIVAGLLDSSVRMHVAVATSLATVIPTSIASALAHHRRGALDVDLVNRWAVPMLLGALAGGLLAARVNQEILTGVFAVVAVLVAAKMLLSHEDRFLRDGVPRGLAAGALPASIGGCPP